MTRCDLREAGFLANVTSECCSEHYVRRKLGSDMGCARQLLGLRRLREHNHVLMVQADGAHPCGAVTSHSDVDRVLNFTPYSRRPA